MTASGPPVRLAFPERAAQGDARTVRSQIGREPRGRWGVAERCSFGRPAVIAVGPLLNDGTPFPTAFWLTCPWLAAAVSDLESAGGCSAWAGRITEDPGFAEEVAAADARYRSARAALSGGADPCAPVGVAGQVDPLAVKCLHARVAAQLAAVEDPVGAGVLAALAAEGSCAECPDDRCRPASAAPDVAVPG